MLTIYTQTHQHLTLYTHTHIRALQCTQSTSSKKQILFSSSVFSTSSACSVHTRERIHTYMSKHAPITHSLFRSPSLSPIRSDCLYSFCGSSVTRYSYLHYQFNCAKRKLHSENDLVKVYFSEWSQQPTAKSADRRR